MAWMALEMTFQGSPRLVHWERLVFGSMHRRNFACNDPDPAIRTRTEAQTVLDTRMLTGVILLATTLIPLFVRVRRHRRSLTRACIDAAQVRHRGRIPRETFTASRRQGLPEASGVFPPFP